MAACAGTVVSVSNFRTPTGRTQTSAGYPILACDIGVTFTGTYATWSSPTTDGATIAAVTTAIQNARRTGKTVTLLSANGSAPGLESTTPIGMAGAIVPWQSAAAGTISGQLTTGTLAAEHGAALLAQTSPLFVHVEFQES
jgi:hypothetical protein